MNGANPIKIFNLRFANISSPGFGRISSFYADWLLWVRSGKGKASESIIFLGFIFLVPIILIGVTAGKLKL
jgi:hypothetical protein